MTTSRVKLPTNLTSDLRAGLTTGIANIPDGMASAILAGANPVQGLYALMVGTPLGAIFGSSAFMNVSTTSALAITTGMALSDYSGVEHAVAISTLAVLTGLVMLMAGLLRLGRLLRFVAHSVVIGFMTGVSLNVILSQLGDFTGYSSTYTNNVARAVDTLLNAGQIDAQTTAIGVLTIAAIVVTGRTRLRNFAMIIGMVIGSASVIILGLNSVEQVSDVAVIPSSLPLPKLPDIRLAPALIVDAIALSIIGLVQGAGVSKSNPNPDGTYPNPSRDFIGQGVANVGAGMFQGMPIGASAGGVVLNLSAGAKSRWADIFSGIVVVLTILLFGQAVGFVAMASVGALLIMAGIQSIKRESIADIWDTGWPQRTVMVTTLALTLAIPLQRAVFLGVVLSIIVYFFITSPDEVRLVLLTPGDDGSVTEGPAPTTLPSEAVTLLEVFGNVSAVGAETLESQLPAVRGAQRPVVILRLRSQNKVGSGFITVLERYSRQLKAGGGKLMLADVSPTAKGQLDRTETTTDVLGKDNVFVATPTVGASTRDALNAAREWLRQAQIEPAESSSLHENENDNRYSSTAAR